MTPSLTFAAEKPVCVKLHKDFVANEKSYAYFYDSDRKMYELELKYGRSRTAPRSAKEKVEDTSREYKEDGDRITTLLIANGCIPPDHVTSPYTYKPSDFMK
jgi:hypothetical protein